MISQSSDTLKMDLQLFAEKDGAEPQQLPNSDLQVLDDEGLSATGEPQPATGDDEKVPEPEGSGEPSQTPQESPKFELKGVTFTEEDVERWSKLEKEVGEQPDNLKQWEGRLHREGQQQNERDTSLKQRETELAGNLRAVTEWKHFTTLINANPQMKKTFQDFVNDPKATIQPEIARMDEKIDARFKSIDEKQAFIDLGKEFKDFSREICEEALEEFDFKTSYGTRKAQYYMWKGLHADEVLQKALAAANSQPGDTIPPLAEGSPRQTPAKKYKTVSEAADGVLKELGLSLD